MRSFNLFLSVTVICGVLGAACAHETGVPRRAPSSEPAALTQSPIAEPAIAIVQPGPDSEIHGLLRFIPDSDGVRVTARVEGLEPNSTHALAIHEYGDCSDPLFTSTGDHLNPDGSRHGSPDSTKKHLGDLGNLTADLNGVAVYEKVLKGIESPRLFAGRSVVIYQNSDDLRSQPSGDSGARLACGVIGIARR
jgi:Cu-Zn family superoxide dismutase